MLGVYALYCLVRRDAPQTVISFRSACFLRPWFTSPNTREDGKAAVALIWKICDIFLNEPCHELGPSLVAG